MEDEASALGTGKLQRETKIQHRRTYGFAGGLLKINPLTTIRDRAFPSRNPVVRAILEV